MDLQQYLQNEKSESVTRSLGALIFHKLADNVASLLTLETASRQLHYGVELSDVNSSIRVVDDVLVQISFASQIINLVSQDSCSQIQSFHQSILHSSRMNFLNVVFLLLLVALATFQKYIKTSIHWVIPVTPVFLSRVSSGRARKGPWPAKLVCFRLFWKKIILCLGIF